MSCNNGNQVLDPLQSIINSVTYSVNTLENQALLIKPYVDEFRSLINSVTPSVATDFNDAIDKFTADAICATSTNLAPINDLTSDCFNEAAKAVKKYLNDILDNIADGIDLITDILLLPENILMNLFQRLKALCNKIKDLIQGIDLKLQCVSLSSQASSYQDQIDNLSDRVSTVTSDLFLADDGSFDSDVLFLGMDEDLKINMKNFEDRTDNLEQEIRDNIKSTVDLTATINPKNFF